MRSARRQTPSTARPSPLLQHAPSVPRPALALGPAARRAAVLGAELGPHAGHPTQPVPAAAHAGQPGGAGCLVAGPLSRRLGLPVSPPAETERPSRCSPASRAAVLVGPCVGRASGGGAACAPTPQASPCPPPWPGPALQRRCCAAPATACPRFSLHFPPFPPSPRRKAIKLQVNTGGGGCFPLHLDSDERLDGRRVTAIFYLNPGWVVRVVGVGWMGAPQAHARARAWKRVATGRRAHANQRHGPAEQRSPGPRLTSPRGLLTRPPSACCRAVCACARGPQVAARARRPAAAVPLAAAARDRGAAGGPAGAVRVHAHATPRGALGRGRALLLHHLAVRQPQASCACARTRMLALPPRPAVTAGPHAPCGHCHTAAVKSVRCPSPRAPLNPLTPLTPLRPPPLLQSGRGSPVHPPPMSSAFRPALLRRALLRPSPSLAELEPRGGDPAADVAGSLLFLGHPDVRQHVLRLVHADEWCGTAEGGSGAQAVRQRGPLRRNGAASPRVRVRGRCAGGTRWRSRTRPHRSGTRCWRSTARSWRSSGARWPSTCPSSSAWPRASCARP